MNQQHIMQADEDVLTDMMMPCLERPEEEGGLLDEIDRPIDRAVVKAMVPVLRERIKVLPDVVDLIDFLFVDEVHPNAEEMVGRRMDEEMVLTSLRSSIDALASVEPFYERRDRVGIAWVDGDDGVEGWSAVHTVTCGFDREAYRAAAFRVDRGVGSRDRTHGATAERFGYLRKACRKS